MNEDRLSQFKEAPRTEFVAALYQRINQPMNAHSPAQTFRRAALTFAALSLLLAVVMLSYPPARVLARNLLMQIGVFSVTTQAPVEGLPTAVPADPSNPAVEANSAAKASQAAGFTVLSPAALPDGYRQAGSLYVISNGAGKVVTSAFITEGSEQFILINQYQAGAGDAYTDSVTGGEGLSEVTVRGRLGAWITGRMMTHPVQIKADDRQLLETNWLLWEEDGVNYTLISNGLSLKEVIAFAENMK